MKERVSSEGSTMKNIYVQCYVDLSGKGLMNIRQKVFSLNAPVALPQ